jgi:hypothetical protein
MKLKEKTNKKRFKMKASKKKKRTSSSTIERIHTKE